MKLRVKGQTAMEYLMTYGWAILIVIVVIAALYSMGVFTVSPGVPCSPCFSYFAFVDYADGTLKIRNGPRTIYFDSYINISDALWGKGTDPDYGNSSDITYNGNTWALISDLDNNNLPECNFYNDTIKDFCSSGNDITLTNITRTGDVVIVITYTDKDSGLQHTDSGTIHNL